MNKFNFFSCSGASNVGQLSNTAVIDICKTPFGVHRSLCKVATSQTQEVLENIVVVDGCDLQCAKKLLNSCDIKEKYHLTITVLGIEKNEDPTFTEDTLALVKDGIQACCVDVPEDNMSHAMGKHKCPCAS